jgi:hypothetical protein
MLHATSITRDREMEGEEGSERPPTVASATSAPLYFAWI